MPKPDHGHQHLPKSAFDPQWYIETNTDVREAGKDPWEHYVTYGHAEGRAGAPVRALALDHILWRGFAPEAEAELRLRLRDPNLAEQAAAGWVLARHAASKGRWRNAQAAIARCITAPAAAQPVRHAGPWLLAIQIACRLGDSDSARQFYDQALERFSDPRSALERLKNTMGRGRSLSRPEREIALAALEIAIATDTDDSEINRHLARLHAQTGLARLVVAQGAGPRFDRLQPHKPPPPVADGPLVSVAVPVYNAADTIATCLRGLCAQSWRNLDIIVIDDASTDHTAQIVAAAAQKDPRIRLLQLPVNGGTYIARNAGFGAARGAYFTVHDADDWSHPQKIAAQVAALHHAPALAATASHWVRADNDLRMTRWRIEDGWIHRNVSSLMIRTALRETVGYWDRIRTNADTEYYHRLLAAFGDSSIQEIHAGIPLGFGRTHATSLTNQGHGTLASQFIGTRRSYMNAARHWHHQQLAALPATATPPQRAAALHLPQNQSLRDFYAPPAIGPADPSDLTQDYARVATSPYFDAAWYLRRNQDVLARDVDPVAHYLAQGAAENRDAGPLFPTAAWRRTMRAESTVNPLLSHPVNDTAPTLPPAIQGDLPATDVPVVLIFAHSADAVVFGAERSLLHTLDRLAHGTDGQCVAPVVILPSAINETYLADIRSRARAVEILPTVWRHRFRAPPAATIAAIREMIRRYRPVAIHVNTLVLDAPVIAARQEGCPVTIHIRELPAQDSALCQLLGDSPAGLRRRLLAEADRFIANSPAVADWIACPERTLIWPNRIDPALFTLPVTPAAQLRVGLVSSNIAKKGIADFISVAKHVQHMEETDKIPPPQRCAFRLIGPDTSDLRALFPLPDNVTHTGYAAGPAQAMQQCDIVLVLSHYAESFGRTALEAMAAGRPVICYDRGTPPSFMDHGQSGLIVPCDAPVAVAQAVMSLARDRNRLLQISARSRAKAAQHGAAD